MTRRFTQNPAGFGKPIELTTKEERMGGEKAEVSSESGGVR